MQKLRKLTEKEIQEEFHRGNLQYFSKWRLDWFDVEQLQIGGDAGLKAYNYRLRIKDTEEEFKY